MPARQQTLNTLTLFQDHFPERLGRAILYRPPSLFSALIGIVKPLMSKSTKDKIIVVSGSCDAGTPNDAMLRRIVGDDWRRVTGATMSQETPASSPGYKHAEAWEAVEKEEREWRRERRLTEQQGPTRGSGGGGGGGGASAAAGAPAKSPEEAVSIESWPGDATCRRSSTDVGAVDVFYECETF